MVEVLITIAKEIRQARNRGEALGLSGDELAFYDALEVNDSAVKVLGDAILRTIAIQLVDTVRQNVAIDWTIKESVRASIRRAVKRVLRRYGYPPNKRDQAAQTVLEQAERCIRIGRPRADNPAPHKNQSHSTCPLNRFIVA